jgi:Na+/proline symporter
MTLQPLDWLGIVFYALALLGIGFGIAPRWERGSGTDAEEFLLAGRRLSLPFFVATLVATWYGAILGVGEFVYRYGVVAWLCLGVPYYVAAVSFALWIAGRIREQQTLTLPEQLQRLYGAAAGRLGALVLLVITIPAAYMLMLAQMLATLLGWRLEMALLLGTVFSVVYLLIGGFRADVLTNALQFVLMYAGFVVLLLFATARLGDWRSSGSVSRRSIGACPESSDGWGLPCGSLLRCRRLWTPASTSGVQRLGRRRLPGAVSWSRSACGVSSMCSPFWRGSTRGRTSRRRR